MSQLNQSSTLSGNPGSFPMPGGPNQNQNNQSQPQQTNQNQFPNMFNFGNNNNQSGFSSLFNNPQYMNMMMQSINTMFSNPNPQNNQSNLNQQNRIIKQKIIMQIRMPIHLCIQCFHFLNR